MARRLHPSRMLAFAVSAALLAGLFGAPSAARAEDSPETTPAPAVIAGTLAAAPALSLAVNAISPGRVHGTSSVEIDMASTTPGGHRIFGLEVRVAAPAHTRLQRLGGVGWRCELARNRSTAVCAHPRVLDRDERPAPIRARLSYQPGVGKTAVVTAWSRWDGEVRHEGAWVTSAEGRITVLPKLRMALNASADTVTTFVNADPEQRQFLLQARLRGLRDEPATLRWRQVRGPAVKFLLPRKVEHATTSVDQKVQVPRSLRPHRYVFVARVRAQGATVTRRITVHTRGAALLKTVDAAMPSSSAIAAATRLAPVRGSTKIVSHDQFAIDGPLLAKTGEQVELRATGSGVPLKDTTWSIDGAEIGIGDRVVVSAPDEAGRAVRVTAGVTLPDGSQRVASQLVMSEARVHAPEEPVDPAAARSTYCVIANGIRSAQASKNDSTRVIELGQTQKFEFNSKNATIGDGVFTRSGACTGSGEISITGAVLMHSENVRLAQITATLTSDALTMTAARLTVSSTASNRLTDRIGLRLAGNLTAPMTGKSFGLVSGAMKFEPISNDNGENASPFSMFMELPSGWDFLPDASRVTFLNSGGSGIDDSVKDGTVRITQVATSPANAAGERGEVAFGVDVLNDTASQLSVTVANLGLGRTPRGGQLVANGHVGVPLTDSKFVLRLNVECQGGWQARECRLFPGMRFSKFTVDWDATKLKLNAEAALDAGGEHAFGLAFNGTYRSNLDWDLQVSNPEPWQFGKGMTFENLEGALVSRPSVDDPNIAVLTARITGSLRGLALSDAISAEQVTPLLTNACPTDDDACSTKELKLYVTAVFAANAPWSDQPVRFGARGKFNFTSNAFRFESGVSDLNVGPKELKLQDLRVVVSNDGNTQCVPDTEDDEDIPVGQYTLQFIGRATILAKDFTLNVQSDSRGLCIWGRGEDISIGGGLKAVSPLMSYATYKDGAKITHDFSGSTETIEVKPNTVSLRGGFEFPDSFEDRFRIPGKGVIFNAILSTDLSSGHFSVAYNAAGEIVLYQGDGANLALGSMGFGVDYSTGVGGKTPAFDGYFYGTGHLNIDGSGSTPSSSTELAVRVGVGYSGTAFTLTLQAGVPSDSPVENAFGIDGLTIRALSASAAVDLVTGTPAFGLNADVTLPPGLLTSVGIAAGTPIVLAANLGAQSPCIEFQVGTTGGPEVVDLGGIGAITGNYLRILYAPLGCEVPDGYKVRTIDAGWSLALEGSLLGGPITLASTFSYSTEGFTMNTTVRLPNWNLYGVELQSADGTAGPKFEIDIDTADDTFKITIDAAIEIGRVSAGRGMLVAMDGDVTMKSDRFVVDLEGKGVATLGPVKLALDPVSLDANIPRFGKASAENALYVEVSTELLASMYFAEVKATGDLTMMGSTVVDLTVKGSGTFDLGVYEVRGTVGFDLCMGTLSDLVEDGTGSECTVFPEDKLATAKPSVRVGVTGVQDWIGADPKPFMKVIYNRVGVAA